jgi:superkiller protein 3
LGYALEQQGNLEAAIAEYEKAVALDPKYAVAQNNLRAAREKLAARRSPPALDDLAFVPSPERNPKVALFRATVIVTARFGAIGQDAGSRNRGAGWVVKRAGNSLWIVTCRHNVIDKLDRPGTELTVQFYSLPPEGQPRRQITTVELLQQDATLDIAVLKVTGAPSDIKPLVMAEESQVQFTGRVMAIGHPYNQPDAWVAPSGDRASYNPQRLKFSFSAPIATGHSGGPVFDENDRLIGMVAEITDETSAAPDPNSETPDLRNAISIGSLAQAIRIQPIRNKLQAWGILP